MTDFKSWDFPRKIKGGYVISLVFKTMDEALAFLKGYNLIGDNSADMQVDQWAKASKKEVDREAGFLKKAMHRFFGRTL